MTRENFRLQRGGLAGYRQFFFVCVCVFFFVFFFWRGYWNVVWSLKCLSFLNYTHKTHKQKKRALLFIILRKKRAFFYKRRLPIFIKKVFKILPLWQLTTWHRNFETRAMLDCRCYGQFTWKRVKNRNKTRTVYTSCFRLRYKWYSSRLIFPGINGPFVSRAPRSSFLLTCPAFGSVGCALTL